jgi:hypothetical protein
MAGSTELAGLLDKLAAAEGWLRDQVAVSAAREAPAEPLMDFLLDLRVNRALVPASLSGLGLDYRGELRMIRAAAAIEPVLGWIVFQLCGNVGRVLSWLDDDTARALLDEASGRIVLSYQDNFGIGRWADRGDSAEISGRWPLASLTRCATHFVLPFMAGDRKRAFVVNRVYVSVPRETKGIGLKASSTTGYIADRLSLSGKGILVDAETRNARFLPEFRYPRAPVKHAGWTLGVWERLRACSCFAALEEATEIAASIAHAEATIWALIGTLEQTMEQPRERAEAANRLSEINRTLTACLLQVALAAYLASPSDAVVPDSPIANLVKDLATMSLHRAVAAPAFAARALLSGPAMAGLRKLCSDPS